MFEVRAEAGRNRHAPVPANEISPRDLKLLVMAEVTETKDPRFSLVVNFPNHGRGTCLNRVECQPSISCLPGDIDGCVVHGGVGENDFVDE